MTVSFDRVSEVYDKTRSLPPQVMAKLVKKLTEELDGCSKVLDVAVGTGRFAKPLQNAGFELVGVDIARKMMGKAKEKDVKNLLRGDARLLPFRDDSFEAAICVHLLHLIEDWQTALRQICRVTRDLMVSLYYANKDPVGEAFDLLLRRHGYQRRRLGKSEQELKELVVPAKSVFVSSYSTLAEDRLNNLAQGTSSSQWEIPVNVNQKAAAELRARFADKVFTQELYIVLWKTQDLNVYLEKSKI